MLNRIPYNEVGPAITALIANTADVIDLSKKRLSVGEINELAAALMKNTSLRVLNLDHCELRSNVTTLAKAIKNHPNLKELMLGYNHIESNLIGAVADILKSPTTALEKLDLSHNPQFNIVPLMNALLQNKKLIQLNLDNCQLHDTHAITLLNGLASNHTLTELNINDNPLTNLTADVLINLLKHHSSLFYIMISGNHITPDKISAINTIISTGSARYDLAVRESICRGLIKNNIAIDDYTSSIFDTFPEILACMDATYSTTVQTPLAQQRKFNFFIHDKLKSIVSAEEKRPTLSENPKDPEINHEEKQPDFDLLSKEEINRRNTSRVARHVNTLLTQIESEHIRNTNIPFRKNILENLSQKINSEKDDYAQGHRKYAATEADQIFSASVKSLLDAFLSRPLLDILATGNHHKKWYTRLFRALRNAFVAVFNVRTKPDSLGFFATQHSKKLLALKVNFANKTEANARQRLT